MSTRFMRIVAILAVFVALPAGAEPWHDLEGCYHDVDKKLVLCHRWMRERNKPDAMCRPGYTREKKRCYNDYQDAVLAEQRNRERERQQELRERRREERERERERERQMRERQKARDSVEDYLGGYIKCFGCAN